MNEKMSISMNTTASCQIVIGGVGGQGVLFVTRLLAEAAMQKGLSVFTSETHGMAQRGGTVISHLKVGEFTSPLITPGRADGLLALKVENLSQHGDYIKEGGWAVVNRSAPLAVEPARRSFVLDADRLARELSNPKALNLVMLGFMLASIAADGRGNGPLYCGIDDIAAVLEKKLSINPRLLQSSLRALRAGAAHAPM
jgi:indolepyruvate ferredoxin oxidoreductase, beta subunit